MRLQFQLSDAYRKKCFVEHPSDVPAKQQDLLLDEQDFPPQVRAFLADMCPDLTVCKLAEPGFVGRLWEAPFMPLNSSEQVALIESYRSARAAYDHKMAAERTGVLQSTLREWERHLALDPLSRTPWLPNDPLRTTDLSLPIAREVRALHKKMTEVHAQDAERVREAARLAQESQERDRAKRVEEKRSWIQTYGSEFLQAAYNQGYDCQRLYAQERAAQEYPGYFLDFEDDIPYTERSCPSRQALAESIKVHGTVVWLRAPLPSDAEHLPEYDEEGSADWPHEAVVVKFLGHDLIKSFPETR